MSELDCGCRVNILVSTPPEATDYTTTFHFCPLHKAAPKLLAALEELDDYHDAPQFESLELKRLLNKARTAIAKAKEA